MIDHPWYRGTWDREELYERLTTYKVLILFSESEGQPLVVIEALAAGLSVVVSKEAASNLDLSQPFIRVVDNIEEIPNAVRELSESNAAMRDQIRKYALDTFDYDFIVGKFESHLLEWSLN